MKKIKIVDLSTLIPGPMATSLLQSELEASIIKYEDINNPDALINMKPTKNGIGLGYQELIKNKKIIKLDFRSQLDKIRSEIKDSDIFIHNFKTNRIFKMGLAFEDALKINPNIIYVSISGYPEKGIMSGKGAHDLNILAQSGYLDQQIKLGEIQALPSLLLADTFTSYFTALKIVAAIYQGNRGILLKISMFEAMMQSMLVAQHFDPVGYPMSGKLPCYGVYKSRDGFVAVAAIESALWTDFCHHLNREDLISKQYETGIVLEIASEMLKYDNKHWMDKSLDFCVTPIVSVHDI